MMTRLLKGQYEELDRLGSGGNGVVFKVRDTKSGEFYALKTLHQHLLNKKSNESRIKRFISEIKVVMEVQDEIPGVLPITNLYLPPFGQIKKGDSPFYLMPIATPLNEKIKGVEIEDKIKCILELSSTLIELHKREIAHRDIKPENIYFLEGSWYLSDFGLVKYPDSEELTRTREAVGPWTTIAPEMKRNAQSADPFPADIYSLAKTLWMTLTENFKGFDGQYNYKNMHVSLENHYSDNVHLTTLHHLLNIATSDEPSERPNAVEFFNILNKWYEIKDSFEKKSRVEWDFILNEISPSGAESMTWRRLDTINTVLNSVSKLKALNHTFLPGGGGLDLQESAVSVQKDYLELDLDGILRLVKPKRLCLETFDDPQWNYFFLETESVQPSGIYEYDEDKFEEYLLEIAPGKYIEPYHKNYNSYNGEVLPSSYREIILGLKGNYVIFPKHSFYNLNMDSYGAYQTKYNTPEKFRKFIDKVIKDIEWHKNNPEISEQIRKQRELKKEEERKIWLEKYKKEKQFLVEFTKSYDLSFFKSVTEDSSNDSFKYFVLFYLEPDHEFYATLHFNLEIKEDDSFTLEGLFSKEIFLEDKYNNHLVFNSWNQAKQFSEIIKDDYRNIMKGFKIIDSISSSIILKRIKRPTQLFTKEDIRQSILNGNDQITNCLVINSDGAVELISISSLDNEYELDKYPVIGERFLALSNTVGPQATYSDEELEGIYLHLLDTWYRHLKDGERKYLSDYYKDDKESLLEKIRIESEKYID
ncbi:protein kinase [Bacillus sp. N3536]|nr:protein kinase [Bacillus sp. N3536]